MKNYVFITLSALFLFLSTTLSAQTEPAPGCDIFDIKKGKFGQVTVTFAANYQGHGVNGSVKHSWSAVIHTPLCGDIYPSPNNNNQTYYSVSIPGDCVTGSGGVITVDVTHCIFGDTTTGWQCVTQTFVIK